MKSKYGKIFFTYGLAILLSILALLPIYSQSIDLDEAYSMQLIKQNVVGIIQGTALDVHPPLYYLILKFFSLFIGNEVVGFRLVSGLATVLNLIFLGATCIRKKFGCRVAVIYMLWFGLSYFTLDKSTFIRMYSWGCFFVTAAILFIFLYHKNKKKNEYIFAILFSLAAMYTHYYAVIAVFVAWMILLIYTFIKERKNSLKVIIAGIIITVGYMPWMHILLKQTGKVAQNYWLKVFNWKEWLMSPVKLLESDAKGIGTVLIFVAIIIMLIAVIRKNYIACLSMFIVISVMVISAILSVTVTPIWQIRYLYNVWGVFSLAVSLALCEKKDVSWIIPQAAIAVLLCGAGVLSVQSLLQSNLFNNSAEEFAIFMDTNIDDDYIIVDDPQEHRVIYECYASEASIIMVEELEKKKITDLINDDTESDMWYIIDHYMPQMGIENVEQILSDAGYHMEHIGSFSLQFKLLDVYRIEE